MILIHEIVGIQYSRMMEVCIQTVTLCISGLPGLHHTLVLGQTMGTARGVVYHAVTLAHISTYNCTCMWSVDA